MSETPNLPTVEELDKVLNAFYDVDEELDEIATRVFKAANYMGEQVVTWAQLGSIAAFAREMTKRATDVADEFRKIETVALVDLEPILRGGDQPHIPQFDKTGRPNYLPNGFMADHVYETYYAKRDKAGSDA